MTPEEKIIEAVEPHEWAVATAPIESASLRTFLRGGWEPFAATTTAIGVPIIVLRRLV